MNLAPVVLFVYNRLNHTKETIQALQKNEFSCESELFIYSDAPKDEKAKDSVNEVREYIRRIDGFKKVTIIEREKNWGLADSIIDGVTKIVNEYGKVIVLEDDLVTSPYFLRFMNEALEFYKDEKKVWHISGWNYPIESNELGDVFLWRGMNCWGWATWQDRWRYYDRDIDKIFATFSKDDIKSFNLDNSYRDFWAQIKANKNNKLQTWAIFWYAKIFKNGGLCLNFTKTLVQNIGVDNSGENCTDNDIYRSDFQNKNDISFSKLIVENKIAYKRIKKFYKNNPHKLMDRIKSRFKKLLK